MASRDQRANVDYYELLGVAPDADVELIKQRYRVLVRENHPDVAADKDDAHARMQLILEAWSVLSQPTQRARYDRARKGRSSPAPPPIHPDVASTTSRETSSSRPREHTAKAGANGGRATTRAKGGGSTYVGPRAVNPRTRLLTMVFEAAQLHFHERRPAEAIALCNRVLKSDPKNAEAAALLGDIYVDQGRHDLALLMYKRAMQNQPSNLLYRQKWQSVQYLDTSGDSGTVTSPGDEAPERQRSTSTTEPAGGTPRPSASAAAPRTIPPEPDTTSPSAAAGRAGGCGAALLLCSAPALIAVVLRYGFAWL
jgi:curved DNA-binding protein CbpA